jgi:hypothetical protein
MCQNSLAYQGVFQVNPSVYDGIPRLTGGGYLFIPHSRECDGFLFMQQEEVGT